MTEDLVNNPEEQVKKIPSKRKYFKWLIWGVGGFLTVVILLLLLIYFTLRSGSLTQSAIPELKPYLEPLGIQLNKLDSLHFDLLKSIELHNLDLNWTDSNVGDVAVSIGKFNFQYSLSDLIQSRAEISQIQLHDVVLSAHIRQSDTSSTPTTTEEDKPFDISEISDMLKNPPVYLDAKNIILKNIRLDIILEQSDGVVEYHGVLSEVSMEMLWKPESLIGFFNLSLGEQENDSQLKVVSRVGEKNVELTASPSLKVSTEWHLENSEDKWILTDTLVNANVKVSNIQTIMDGQNPIVLDSIDFDIKNTLSSLEGAVPMTGLDHLFPLNVESKISSNVDNLKLSNFRQDDITLTSQLNHRLNMTIDGQINPLSQDVPAIRFAIDESLNLDGIELSLADQKVNLNNFKWDFSSKGDTANSGLAIVLKADANIDGLKYKKPEGNKDEPGLDVSLEPEFYVDSTIQLSSFDKPIENLIAQLKPKIILKNINAKIVEEKNVKSYQLAEVKINMDASYNKSKIDLDTTINLKEINIPELKTKTSITNIVKLETNVLFDELYLDTRLFLDRNKLFEADIGLMNKSNDFSLKHDININLSPKLTKYHGGAKELEKIGKIQLSLLGNTKIKHKSNNIQSVDFSDVNKLLKQLSVNTNGNFMVKQHQRPKSKEGVVLTGPVQFDYEINNQNNYQIDLNLDVAGVKVSPLEKAIPLRLKSQNNLTWPLSLTYSQTKIDVANKRAIDLDIIINDKKQALDVDTKISLNINPDWQTYLQDLKELGSIGALKTKIDLSAKIKHPFKSLMDIDVSDKNKLEQVSGAVNIDTTLSQSKTKPGSLLVLAKTAHINQKLDWSRDHVNWLADIDLPDVLISDVVALKQIKTNIKLNANSGFSPDEADLTLKMHSGKIHVLSVDKSVEALDIGHVITPINFDTSASWTTDLLTLKKLNLNVGSDLLGLTTFGTVSLDGKNAQIESTITSTLREKLYNQPAVSGTGNIKIPIRLTMLEGKQVALEGEMIFDHLNLSIDDIAIHNMNGSLKLEEELLIDKESAKFRYLLDPNPFQRVDFTRIQPYLNTSSISIDKIQIADKSIGPVLASIKLKQNIFRIQQFDIDLFSGHTGGQFYLDVRPGEWKLGLLSRITNLDPRQILNEDSSLRESKLSPINTRTAIEFDIHKRLMEGEIVVSDINRDQLLQLLDIVDPTHEDEQMAQLRKGLRFSHPELVQVNMQRGLMNLKVEIAGLPKAIRVSGLPLTPMIQQFASEVLTEIDNIPLQ